MNTLTIILVLYFLIGFVTGMYKYNHKYFFNRISRKGVFASIFMWPYLPILRLILHFGRKGYYKFLLLYFIPAISGLIICITTINALQGSTNIIQIVVTLLIFSVFMWWIVSSIDKFEDKLRNNS